MNVKLLATTLIIAAVPTLVSAGCFGSHGQQEARISCAEGTTYDADAEKCVPETTS